MEINNKIKLNISVTPGIRDYISEQANYMGMSSSAFLTMLVSQYKQQSQALNSIDQLKIMMKELQEQNEMDKK